MGRVRRGRERRERRVAILAGEEERRPNGSVGVRMRKAKVVEVVKMPGERTPNGVEELLCESQKFRATERAEGR